MLNLPLDLDPDHRPRPGYYAIKKVKNNNLNKNTITHYITHYITLGTLSIQMLNEH